MPSNSAQYAACSRCIDEQLANNPNSTIDDCKYCRDVYKKPGADRCVGGHMINNRCYCIKRK